MPKRLPPNNRPWPHNLLYDFGLPETISPADSEAFISSLPTTERNKQFLRLRYREGKRYNEIADEYGLTPSGVRLAVKAMWEKYGGSPGASALGASAPAAPGTPAPPASVAASALSTPPTVPTTPPPVDAFAPSTPPNVPIPPSPTTKNERMTSEARPLSLNLAAVRRLLNLTPEEFARPISIDDGESLITRLETGFSKPSSTVLDLICDAWGINRSYLLTGQGEMFDPGTDYCSALTTLLKTYLSVVTFDRQGRQYWKGTLVDDLGRIIDVRRLSGREMAQVVRALYDYLDVEQFETLLERMGR